MTAAVAVSVVKVPTTGVGGVALGDVALLDLPVVFFGVLETEPFFSGPPRADDAAAEEASSAGPQYGDASGDLGRASRRARRNREPRIDDEGQEVEVGQSVEYESTQMAIRAAKDDVAGPQHLREGRLRERGFANRHFGA